MAKVEQEAEPAGEEAEERLEPMAEAVAPLFVAEEKSEVVKPAAEEEASVAPAQGNGDTVYQGMVELDIAAVDAQQISNLLSYLREVPILQVVSLSGSATRDNTVVVVANRPLPLLSVLREMPPVETAIVSGNKIEVTLKTKNGS